MKSAKAAAATEPNSRSPHLRIVVGLPNLQDQIRMLNRLADTASEPEHQRMRDLSHLLAELYGQLQHQKQVTVFRVGGKDQVKPSVPKADP